jgi:SNF2 family DNA or RNA helicase
MMGNYETTNFSTALIVCPLNTVLNWQHEVQMWLEDNEVQLEVCIVLYYNCVFIYRF